MNPQVRALLLLAAIAGFQLPGRAQSDITGLQDPAWAPDGKRIAVSYLDRLWTMAADGRQAKPITGEGAAIEREPAWSSDGTRLAFSSHRGEGFDIYVVSVKGGPPVAVTTMPGDERWPSWTPDGRLVFAHRDDKPQGRAADPGLQWDLFAIAPVVGSESWQAPLRWTETTDNET